MGIFDAWRGRSAEPPPLDPASPAAARVAAAGAALEAFVRRLPDRVELVPGTDAVYAFFGRPPGGFGAAWFEGGREHGFKSIAEEHGLSQARIQTLAARLGAACRRHAAAERRSAAVAGKPVLVILSEPLAEEFRRAIRDALA